MEEELGVEEEEEEEEEFTPSAWNAALAPHRSALRSPDKTLKSGVSCVVDRYIIRCMIYLKIYYLIYQNCSYICTNEY